MCSRLLTALLLLGLLQDAAPTSQDQFRMTCSGQIPVMGCPDGWNQIRSEECVKAFTEKKTFDDAEQHCVSLGGHLASVHGGSEPQIVFCFLAQTYNNRTPFWIGAYYDKEKQRYRWTDSSKFSHVTWSWTMSDDENEACVEINPRDWGRWKSVNCDLKRSYMCMQRSD